MCALDFVFRLVLNLPSFKSFLSALHPYLSIRFSRTKMVLIGFDAFNRKKSVLLLLQLQLLLHHHHYQLCGARICTGAGGIKKGGGQHKHYPEGPEAGSILKTEQSPYRVAANQGIMPPTTRRQRARACIKK